MSEVILLKKVFDSCSKLLDIVIEHDELQNERIPVPSSITGKFQW